MCGRVVLNRNILIVFLWAVILLRFWYYSFGTRERAHGAKIEHNLNSIDTNFVMAYKMPMMIIV